MPKSNNSAHYLLNDYLKKHLNSLTVDYFRQTTKHYQIWLSVLSSYFQKEEISIEQIKKVTKNISLKTISSIISDAEKLNYISRVKFAKDTRKKNIIPTAKTIKDYKSWVECLAKNLNANIKK